MLERMLLIVIICKIQRTEVTGQPNHLKPKERPVHDHFFPGAGIGENTSL